MNKTASPGHYWLKKRIIELQYRSLKSRDLIWWDNDQTHPVYKACWRNYEEISDMVVRVPTAKEILDINESLSRFSPNSCDAENDAEVLKQRIVGCLRYLAELESEANNLAKLLDDIHKLLDELDVPGCGTPKDRLVFFLQSFNLKPQKDETLE